MKPTNSHCSMGNQFNILTRHLWLGFTTASYSVPFTCICPNDNDDKTTTTKSETKPNGTISNSTCTLTQKYMNGSRVFFLYSLIVVGGGVAFLLVYCASVIYTTISKEKLTHNSFFQLFSVHVGYSYQCNEISCGLLKSFLRWFMLAFRCAYKM